MKFLEPKAINVFLVFVIVLFIEGMLSFQSFFGTSYQTISFLLIIPLLLFGSISFGFWSKKQILSFVFSISLFLSSACPIYWSILILSS